MLEKPNLPDDRIRDCLHRAYALSITDLAFLPLGADTHTAVYRAQDTTARPYFIKLRRGAFDATTVQVPKHLADQGVPHLIAPLPNHQQAVYTALPPYTLTVAPFIEGQDGYSVPMEASHWAALGATLRGLHHATLPANLVARIPHERYSSYFRELVLGLLTLVATRPPVDAVAESMAALLQEQRETILTLVRRAEVLAQVLLNEPRPEVVCHGDLHAGNVLITPAGDLYVVDWDTLVLAPKERDLMFIGGAQGFQGQSATEEEALFYQSYGTVTIDSVALAYYRYERIVQDIAAYGETILLSPDGGDDRANGLRQLRSQFAPDAVIANAFATDVLLPSHLRAL